MLSKLTLTIEHTVVEKAKDYAHQKNKSVSRIVEEYLDNVSGNSATHSPSIELKSPITDSLSGMFKDNGKSYKEMLEESLLEKYL